MKTHIYLAVTICLILFTSCTEIESQINTDCLKWSKSHLNLYLTNYYSYNEIYFAYVKFDALTQLNISCGMLTEYVIDTLGLASTKANFLLDQYFNIRPLLGSFKFQADITSIEIHNLKGFNLHPDPKYNKKSTPGNEIDTFVVVDSHFDFYMNETRLITHELCVQSNFKHAILNLAAVLVFANVYYTSRVCPYVFMRSPFESISFDRISNSLIYKIDSNSCL